uniref:DUF4485 domain-containing protein n=1 Tax=Glossina pallidipes TaxID=7398 RepID=A0A1B0AAM9_GLOPL
MADSENVKGEGEAEDTTIVAKPPEEPKVEEPPVPVIEIDDADSPKPPTPAKGDEIDDAVKSKASKPAKVDEGPKVDKAMSEEISFLSEQFDNYSRFAKVLMKTLKRPKDIESCNELLRKVERLNDSRHVEVKRNVNQFMRYCLKIIHWTSQNQPTKIYEAWYCRAAEKDKVGKLSETSTWIGDRKSYIAVKSLPDGATLLYAAVTNNPESGWEEGGLKILEQRGACKRV